MSKEQNADRAKSSTTSVSRRSVLKSTGTAGLAATAGVASTGVTAADNLVYIMLYPSYQTSNTADYAVYGRNIIQNKLLPQLNGDVNFSVFLNGPTPGWNNNRRQNSSHGW